MINLIIMAKCLRSVNPDHHVEKNDFLEGTIAMPARRALRKEKIDSLEKLSAYSEKEISNLHGFGKNTMLKLKKYMEEHHVFFDHNGIN